MHSVCDVTLRTHLKLLRVRETTGRGHDTAGRWDLVGVNRIMRDQDETSEVREGGGGVRERCRWIEERGEWWGINPGGIWTMNPVNI